MSIQDLANNLFLTASSPMIGWADTGLVTQRELSLRMYQFLIEGIREEDQTNGAKFLERFFEGPQEVWQINDAAIRSLPDMWSITRCEDRFLQFLKCIVGWTSELNYITDDMDAVTLRRLIATSVPFWKIRGTEEATIEIVRLTTAARVRMWDWFDLRFVVDEIGLGEENQGRDPWMIDLPGPPDYEERRMNLRIVDDGTLNRRLVRNLVRLTRPAGERVTISYLGFLDLFDTDDDSSQWSNVVAGLPLPNATPVVANGIMTITGIGSSYCYVRANPSAALGWRNYVVSARVRGDVSTMEVYWTAYGESYIVLLAPSFQIIEVGKLVAGVPSVLAFVNPFTDMDGLILDANDFYMLRVAVVPEAGQTRMTVWLDGNFVCSILDGSHTQGSVAFPDIYAGGFEVAEVEMFFNPLSEDVIDIVTSTVEEPS